MDVNNEATSFIVNANFCLQGKGRGEGEERRRRRRREREERERERGGEKGERERREGVGGVTFLDGHPGGQGGSGLLLGWQ